MSKYFYVRQEEAMDCGLATILLYYNKPYSLNHLKKWQNATTNLEQIFSAL